MTKNRKTASLTPLRISTPPHFPSPSPSSPPSTTTAEFSSVLSTGPSHSREDQQDQQQQQLPKNDARILISALLPCDVRTLRLLLVRNHHQHRRAPYQRLCAMVLRRLERDCDYSFTTEGGRTVEVVRWPIDTSIKILRRWLASSPSSSIGRNASGRKRSPIFDNEDNVDDDGKKSNAVSARKSSSSLSPPSLHSPPSVHHRYLHMKITQDLPSLLSLIDRAAFALIQQLIAPGYFLPYGSCLLACLARIASIMRRLGREWLVRDLAEAVAQVEGMEKEKRREMGWKEIDDEKEWWKVPEGLLEQWYLESSVEELQVGGKQQKLDRSAVKAASRSNSDEKNGNDKSISILTSSKRKIKSVKIDEIDSKRVKEEVIDDCWNMIEDDLGEVMCSSGVCTDVNVVLSCVENTMREEMAMSTIDTSSRSTQPTLIISQKSSAKFDKGKKTKNKKKEKKRKLKYENKNVGGNDRLKSDCLSQSSQCSTPAMGYEDRFHNKELLTPIENKSKLELVSPSFILTHAKIQEGLNVSPLSQFTKKESSIEKVEKQQVEKVYQSGNEKDNDFGKNERKVKKEKSRKKKKNKKENRSKKGGDIIDNIFGKL